MDNNNNGGGLNFWKPYQSSGISGNGFLWLGDNGNVGVGCTNPQYKLDVMGTIRAKEVRVKVTGCDFVLEKPYLLEPLKLRREKVLSDKHLPHLPNANGEVEMNTRDWMEGIWQNVEEHELYLYELYEKIQQLERENMILKQKIEEMKK